MWIYAWQHDTFEAIFHAVFKNKPQLTGIVYSRNLTRADFSLLQKLLYRNI